MKKIHFILMIVLILCGIFSIIGFAANNDLQIIKIGLQYPKSEEDSRLPLAMIKTDAYFEFGEIVDQTYVKHLELNGLNTFSFDFNDDYYSAIGPLDSYEASKALSDTLGADTFVVKAKGIMCIQRAIKVLKRPVKRF